MGQTIKEPHYAGLENALAKDGPHTLKKLKDKCWRSGDITYKFKTCQAEMYEKIQESTRFKYVIKCARRLGKSYLLCSYAIMKCLQKPLSQVKYAAPTHKALQNIVLPIINKIFLDAPEELKPEWKASLGKFVFKNGSEIQLAGVNNGHADDLRGTTCDLFVVDEAGTVDELHYLVHDVAMPQFLDPDGKVVANRRLLIASSPARTPAHDFTAMAQDAEANGYYSHYTIFDGEYPRDVIKLFLLEDGISEHDISSLLNGNLSSIKSSTVRREYLAEDVVDEELALCPEWNSDYEDIFQVDKYYPYYHKYEALDIGVRDLTVCLFAHYDFQKARLFIHDEVVLSGPDMHTAKLAECIKIKESHYFGKSPVRKRISDIDLPLINSLRASHSLPFESADKGHLEEMVNEVRLWVSQGKIIVHPRCRQALGSLRYGVWNPDRTRFDRSHVYGHYDAFAALMYLVRSIDRHTNPIPHDFEKPVSDFFFFEESKNTAKKQSIREAFSLKR